MIPKLKFRIRNTIHEFEFKGSDLTLMNQEWVSDEVEYKHPFTGRITRKSRGYYYQATLTFDGVYYDLMAKFRDFLNKEATDLIFYPSNQTSECYEVDANNIYTYDDAHAGMINKNFELIFRGKQRMPTPLNYPMYFWGARRITFLEIGHRTFESFEQ